MRILLILALLLPAGFADTIVLKSGLELHGKVTEKGDRIELLRDGKTTVLRRSSIRQVKRGESRVEEYQRRAAELGDDAAAWYRLSMWARENGVARQRKALERVVELDKDHRAARRELGFEKIGGEWIAGDEAMRRKGFVLCAGKWVLPKEADRLMRHGLMKQAKVTDAHRRRAEEIAQALTDDDEYVRKAAAEMLDEVPDGALVRPLKKVLYAPSAESRTIAVRTLSRIGDRVALPWLIRSSMYDANRNVRNTAFRAVKGFKDHDIFYPYARALFSRNPRVSIAASQVLSELGDDRGVDLILRRVSIGIGESGRANISVGTQNSYIADFDVEIAQAAAIGDPIIGTIRDGIILDFKILGGYGERWIVEQRIAYASALSNLTGRDYGQDWKAYANYARENELPRVALK